MYRLLTLGFCFVSCFCFGQKTFSHTLYFNSNSSTAKEQEIKKMAHWLLALPKVDSLTINGHTDSVGSAEANLKLSRQRVNQLKPILFQLGLPIPQLNYLGETKPAATNATEAGRAKNRRVEIVAWATEQDSSTIFDLLSLLEPSHQVFTINNQKDTLLKADGGTIIKVPANAFSAPCGAAITLRVKEALALNQVLLNDLTTTSNGKMLETRGMIYVEANCSGKALQLKPNKALVHFLPASELPENLQLFIGVRNPIDSAINWQVLDDDIASINWNGFTNCCLSNQNCPLFFCKIRRFFGNEPQRLVSESDCGYYKILLMELGIKNEEQLKLIMLKYEVNTLAELQTKIDLEKLQAGTISTSRLKTLVFEQKRLGWVNCDFFSNFPERDLITLRTNLKANHETRAYLIFNNENVVIPARIESGKLVFVDVPKDKNAQVFALKYANKQVYTDQVDLEISKSTVPVNLEAISLAQLKTLINNQTFSIPN